MSEYKIEVKQIDPQPIVSIRVQCRWIEIGETLAEILPEVWRYLRKHDVYPAGPPFTRYHGYSDNKVDLEGGMPVADALPGEGRIAAGELPGGMVAMTTHTGAYEDLPDAHEALQTWITTNGKKSLGPHWEIYVTDPGKEPDPFKRKTDLCWPIE